MTAIASPAGATDEHARPAPPAMRKAADKVTARRNELAVAALVTLAQRGYANTSLRDVAQNSQYSHGVLHYYFADKTDLISHCVRVYKDGCIRRYEQVTEQATSAEHLIELFLDALQATLVEDTGEQRLWYDMRAESLFEPAFREAVAEIDTKIQGMLWRILTSYAAHSGAELVVDEQTAYAVFDGVFQRAVQDYVAGHGDARPALVERVRVLVPRMVA